MTTIDLTAYVPAGVSNNGIAREWAACAYKGIERNTHDHNNYIKSSDIVCGSERISVKSSHSSIMAACLCNGATSLSDIWDIYKRNTHSNVFYYVAKDYTAYVMDMPEFEQFMLTFGVIEHESAKNGSGAKLRIRIETKKMVRWLQARVA